MRLSRGGPYGGQNTHMTAINPTSRFSALLHALGADLTTLAQKLDAGEVEQAHAEDHLRAYSNQMDHIEQHAEDPEALPTPEEMRQQVADEAQGYAAARARDDD